MESSVNIKVSDTQEDKATPKTTLRNIAHTGNKKALSDFDIAQPVIPKS